MSDLPPDIRQFLEGSRHVHEASGADRTRVWTALSARLVATIPPAPVPVPHAPPAASPPAPVPPASSVAAVAGKIASKMLVAKVISSALLVVAGGVAVGTYDRVARHPVLTPAPASLSTTSAAPRSAPVDPAASASLPPYDASSAAETAPDAGQSGALGTSFPAEEPDAAPSEGAASAGARTQRTAASQAPEERVDQASAATVEGAGTSVVAPPSLPGSPSSVTTLSREVTLLRAAEASLRRGDARGALAQLQEHERDFPEGTLRQERMAEEALTLCALKDPARARVLSATLAHEAPRSPSADRLAASCAGWPVR